jgi:mannose-6-phosphate isomerase
MFELVCVVQSYDWGKIGRDSRVAVLGEKAADLKIGENVPYAELWMGDHPSGAAKIKVKEDLLEDLNLHISKNPIGILGEDVAKKYHHLPFLFKVLSIAKALSIQAHPDKELAQRLYQTRPDLYKDPNHKPEMALAITPMQALCGFRPEKELQHHLDSVHTLREVIGHQVCDEYVKIVSLPHSSAEQKIVALKLVFRSLMTADNVLVKNQLDILIKEIEQKAQKSVLDNTILRVHSEFPGDVGVFGLYLLNIINFEPGEAIFLGPNVPHAYLQGDCIECMATSDNCVRAGLTPKPKDVETLVSMLTYRTELPKIFTGNETKTSFSCKEYIPPVEEFKIKQLIFPPHSSSKVNESRGPSIFIICDGEGKATNQEKTIQISKGSVLFTYANVAPTFTSTHKSTPLLIYQATSNITESKY